MKIFAALISDFSGIATTLPPISRNADVQREFRAVADRWQMAVRQPRTGSPLVTDSESDRDGLYIAIKSGFRKIRESRKYPHILTLLVANADEQRTFDM